MRLTDMEVGIIIGLLLMIVSHTLISRYWLAGLTAAVICSVANTIHEGYLVGFSVRPADVVFWIPITLVMGFAMLTPPSYLVGLPFMLYRRRMKKLAEQDVASNL